MKNEEAFSTCNEKTLSEEDQLKLNQQDTRLVSDYKANLLEIEARKHWDLFYKRNETRFFKDRHWTTREFQDLLNAVDNEQKTLLEVGCGVGNFIFPLIKEKLNFHVLACDLSPRAVQLVKNNDLFDSDRMKAFPCDITTKEILRHVERASIDIATLIFVLSAIHPDKFKQTLQVVFDVLKPGGVLLFRDYGLYDMAQLRFKAGHKISENLYMRQDGTRSYYFSTGLVENLLQEVGFEVNENCYIHRRTVNKKEGIDVPRIFVQSKATKPAT